VTYGFRFKSPACKSCCDLFFLVGDEGLHILETLLLFEEHMLLIAKVRIFNGQV
jgi:hypothetical protein